MNGNTAPDLATLRQGLHVSYSQIRCFTLCPAKFEHQYLLGTEPSHRPVALVFGGSTHHALAAYYNHVQANGEAMSMEAIQDAFRGRWEAEMDLPVPIEFGEKKDAGAFVDQGVDLLRVFHAQAGTPDVLAVEQPFSVDLVDPVSGEVLDLRLVGAFDLVVRESSGPVIVEHKTAARKYTREQLAYDLQPSIYRYAAREMEIDDARVRYQILVKTKTPGVMLCDVERTDADIREALETVCSVLDGIEAGVAFRNRGWACSDCQFAYRCRA